METEPTEFESEEAVIKTFRLQRCPDEEFTAKITDGVHAKYCEFDGDDALILLAVFCYRGLQDEVFKLNIHNYISEEDKYWVSEEKRDEKQ